jgi:hypothetical protein
MPTEKIENAIAFVKDAAEKFGAKPESYVFRKNVDGDALQDNGGYFGIIQPEEEVSGPYHDFSFTVNPSLDDKPWYINICVGLNGFKNDYELASRPGLRRLFSRLVNNNGFCKTDFSDIETSLPASFTQREDLQHFKNTIKKYSRVYTAFQIVPDTKNEEGKKIIAAFIAAYARLRDWPSNRSHRDAVSEALAPFTFRSSADPLNAIEKLVAERRFVVLQGPPGTGKTRTAKKVAKNSESEVFFTQFHAETTYADFIYGIRPDVHASELTYAGADGIFTQALKFATENSETRTVLIIDEINRANLSNVLGPVFYLFEPKMGETGVTIEISPELTIDRLPSNFFVIATMNTADRSLAVVDFALRRRFAWYSLRPESIPSTEFYKDDFDHFNSIFEWYASSEELSLQPGQGYFLAAGDEEMKNRVRYELYPLIKEYLQEGLLSSAKEEFNNYFSSRIQRSLYE